MSPASQERTHRLLEKLAKEWAAFQESLFALPEASYLESGVVDHWSLRDLLVHITSWEEEALKAIPIVLDGSRLPRYSQLYGGIDAFNAKTQADRKHLPLTQVQVDMWATHQRLVTVVELLPAEALVSGGRLARRLRQDTYRHYREHTAHVIEWRRHSGR